MNDWYQPGYENEPGFIFTCLVACAVAIVAGLGSEVCEYLRARRRAQRGGGAQLR